MWCETDGEKEDRTPNGDVGIEGNSGSDGKGEWSEMVRACVKEGCGHVLRKALEFEVKGKRKRGRPRKTWRPQVEKESKSVGLKRRIQRIERDGEWKWERLLAEWGKSGHPRLRG